MLMRYDGEVTESKCLHEPDDYVTIFCLLVGLQGLLEDHGSDVRMMMSMLEEPMR